MKTTYKQLYLNQSGHRWVNVDNKGKHDRVNIFFPETNTTKEYAVAYYEAIGNFAVGYVKIKSKMEQLMEYKEGIYMVNNEVNRNIKNFK